MSLEALNSPPLIGILTAGCYCALPFVVNNPLFLSSLPWSTIKGLNILAYGISIYSVTRTGRYDSQQPPPSSSSSKQASELKKKNDDVDVDVVVDVAVDGIVNEFNDGNNRSLLNPAGYAFSIWGIIFIGELIMVSTPYISSSPSTSTQLIIREITGPYMMSQLFQILWCASFRPKYNRSLSSSSAVGGGGGGLYKYISVFNLTGIAVSLSFCHDAFTTTNDKSAAPSYSNMNYWCYFLPLTLHFGWTTAASLVNLNGMYAMRSSPTSSNSGNNNDNSSSTKAKAKSVAVLGNISVIIATTIGITVTYIRNAPVYGGVICWALTAVSVGLKKRLSSLLLLNKNDKNDKIKNKNKVGMYGAKTQQTLCQIGAIACAMTSAFVVVFSGHGS
ncbi:hypothetical protein FRACYDRAFT_251366 [Fragilariopsis cylindrus CCMP1102]|uniref:Uncharacterized protein n=1 Tax=Fragilariopsis cylindrus CCMP1102 TaxID=635003 RepID=A0A1E7EMT7_9STRA|nr:hypothetical protein FRACYDRAFT_251366 [Fragilariopsis cylindrus CCMP1102]|eukprot:OEU07262.1 hypothetical protein FRACYDRAFT_251366 [Fragilariopsis cylindrus CCMP1102]